MWICSADQRCGIGRAPAEEEEAGAKGGEIVTKAGESSAAAKEAEAKSNEERQAAANLAQREALKAALAKLTVGA